MSNKTKTKQELEELELELLKLELENEEEKHLAELEKLLQEEDYELASSSFYEFHTSAWSYFDPEPYQDNWSTHCICEHAQALIEGKLGVRNLLINISPRCSKSSIMSISFPDWVWGPYKKPETKFITASSSDRLASQFVVKSRQLITHPWYKNKWYGKNKSFAFTPDSNTKTRIDNDKNGYRIATTPEGLGLGIGYDIFIGDDVIDKKHAKSKTELENINDWYRGVIRNRANNQETAIKIILMQRLAEQDIAGYVLEAETDKWFHLIIPMEYDKKFTFLSPISCNDPRINDGDLMWPSRFSESFLEVERKNPYAYAAMYQQQPAPKEGSIIKSSWIKFYYVIPSNFDSVIQVWDLSMVNTESADYTVGAVFGKKNNHIYLIDLIRGKMDAVEQLQAIRDLSEKYPEARYKLIEAKANGPAIISMLQRNLAGITPLQPKDYGGNKEARLQACVPEFSTGFIHIPEESSSAPWVKDVINELILFPKGRNDDIIDVFAYGISWLAEKCKSSVLKIEPNLEIKNSPRYFIYGDSEYNLKFNSNNKVIRGYFN